MAQHQQRYVLGIVFGLAALPAAAAIAPALPRERINTAVSAQTGTVWRVAASCGDLQAKIDGARLGDTILIPQGIRCTGNYVLRAKPAGTGWIFITGTGPLPAPGTRITPANAAALPKLVSPNSAAPLRTDAAAHHYRLIGLEITVAPTVAINYELLSLGTVAASQSTLSAVPHDIVVDRCYIHGNPKQAVKRGIGLNSARTAVIDSYVSEIHNVAQDTQAIAGSNGPGPFKIVNNRLEGAAENIMFGGAASAIPGLVPSDIEIRGNHLYKPLSWRIGDPSYTGDNWSVKNLFELKNARRVLLDGNVLENCWANAQRGFAIVLTPRALSGLMPWAAVEDITISRNIIRHAAAGMMLYGSDNGQGGIARRVLVKDNLFDDINGPKWGGGPGTVFSVNLGLPDLQIEHNTLFQSGKALAADGTVPAPGFEYVNNIAANHLWGSRYGVGTPVLNFYFPGWVVYRNVIAGASASAYPAGNYFPATLDSVGFVNRAGGDYRLSTTSPYRFAGMDGKDLGMDVSAVTQASSAAIRGTAPPPYAGQ